MRSGETPLSTRLYQAGHRLELYTVPFLGYASFDNPFVRESLLGRKGLDESSLMSLRTDYIISIENAASYATLPLLEAVDLTDGDDIPAPADEGEDDEPTPTDVKKPTSTDTKKHS